MHPKTWTLRTRLIALTVALVAATSVVIGGVMFLVIRQALADQFDQQLDTSAQAVDRAIAFNGRVPIGQFGVDSGTAIAYYPQGGTASGAVVSESNEPSTFSSRQLAALQAASGLNSESVDPQPRSAVFDGQEYRFVITSVPENGSVVVGKPTAPLNAQLAAALLPIVFVVAGAILLAGLIAALILRRAFRPLRRVAAVASTVADMPLDRGDVQLAQRVPERDTDPHTEVGQVGFALNALLDSVSTALAVRQASEEKVRTFVADASHELRTPLASIRGYAELTRRFGGDLGETVEHNIGRIESEAQRMTSLVEDLLLLARLDAERELDRAEVDLSRLLLDVLSDAHAAGPDHEWDIDLPPEPVIVYGDDAKLHQVFTNLLANARVHTPAGTRVSVGLREPQGDSAVVVVRDGGPGIPDDLQPKLFERFARGDSSRHRGTGSTGLGLSIVQAVVAAHHGVVEVSSRPGETVFTVRLPLHQPAARREPALA